MYFVIVYLIFCCFCSFVNFVRNKAMDAYVKRIGYFDTFEDLTFYEKLLHSERGLFKYIIKNFIPYYNLYNLVTYIYCFDNDCATYLKDGVKNGTIVSEEELENNNIPLKIIAVRKMKTKMDSNNQIPAYTELDINEKISFLLRELELAYEEKARIEGIPLEENLSILNTDFQDDVIKLVLDGMRDKND